MSILNKIRALGAERGGDLTPEQIATSALAIASRGKFDGNSQQAACWLLRQRAADLPAVWAGESIDSEVRLAAGSGDSFVVAWLYQAVEPLLHD
jgi:hypothetical protein